MPKAKELVLEASDELAAKYFLERREMGIINIAGDGSVVADSISYPMKNMTAFIWDAELRK